MITTKKMAGLLMVSMGMVAGVYGQQVHSITAAEAAQLAAKNNVTVKNALLDIARQEQTNREITAMAYPAINASASLTDNLQLATNLLPGEFFGQPGTYIPVKFGTKFIGSGGLQLRQILFDGQVFVGLQARQSTMELSRKKYEVTEEAIRTNVYKIYYQLAISKHQIRLLDSNISRLDKLKHDMEVMYKNGFVERLDVDKVTVQSNNLTNEKSKVLNQIAMGQLGLKTLLGLPAADSLVLTEDITEDKLKEDLLATVDYKDRKDYQMMTVAEKLGEYNIKRYKLSQVPTLAFVLSHSQQAQRQKFTFFKTGDDYKWFPSTYYNVSLSIPIFNGFMRRAQIEGAKIELSKTRNEMEQLKLNIDNQAAMARLSINSALISMANQRRNMELAEKVYGQTKTKYEIGMGSQMEITNAQADLVQAQTGYISAMYDAIIARIDYLKAIGKLQ